MKKACFILMAAGVVSAIFSNNYASTTAQNYTLLNKQRLQQVFHASRIKIQNILQKKSTQESPDQTIIQLIKSFLNKPYLYQSATGESDWQAGHWHYTPGAMHIQQDPVYRTDGFDCTTFASMILALANSNNIDQFDKTILRINYGAAPGYSASQVHYFNRNHFISADFNPNNEKNGYIKSAHFTQLKTKNITVTITRNNWFKDKKTKPQQTIRVFTPAVGQAMLKRLLGPYPPEKLTGFDKQIVTLSYIPKSQLMSKTDRGYTENLSAFKQIPTPSIVEFVRNKPATSGSRLIIGHMAILYRQTFRKNQLIYYQTSCRLNSDNEKACSVTPIYCGQKQCKELMLAEATTLYPNNYYWYQKNGRFVCRKAKPHAGTPYTHCNRVISLPLAAYLARKMYGRFDYMDDPTRLGLHIESINIPTLS
ncbi:MAG: hypothetical protein COV52_00305 [Gammaproteobacteria bacterium CG11_big_fil_rev_8_21_14_0_20_46_22]|nr:MAG: hypothetical protein COW05_09200 [Gammaproteobacteria bacterium CG12_big_fil_rev_8_21_14_0_65_46_12]PIR12100.1 MAG: hypothetical protein COV52_00305 [Gammaproteobacteria bacterium CG11_big_fil_rev_8_21_14_0_20_46_22]